MSKASMSSSAAPARRLGLLLALAAAVGCLAAAHAVVGQWAGAAAAAAVGALLVARGKLGGWAPTAFLLGMVLVAGAGAVTGAPSSLLVAGTVLALAAWDLSELQRFLFRGGAAPGRASGRTSGRRHDLLLAWAVALGLLCAAAGLLPSFQIPFPVMLLLVILDLACLGLAYRTIRR